jgi:hypothetical protein
MKSNYIGVLLIAFFTLVVSTFIVWQVANNLILINETFALLLLTGSIIAKWYKSEKTQLVIFFLLFIPLFDILSYSYTIEVGDTTTTYNSGKFDGLINPVVFLVFVFYLVMNASVIIKQFRFIFKGSVKEIEGKSKKEITFYYNKFNVLTSEELIDVFSLYDKYPIEAKIAIDMIKKEKK